MNRLLITAYDERRRGNSVYIAKSIEFDINDDRLILDKRSFLKRVNVRSIKAVDTFDDIFLIRNIENLLYIKNQIKDNQDLIERLDVVIEDLRTKLNAK